MQSHARQRRILWSSGGNYLSDGVECVPNRERNART